MILSRNKKNINIFRLKKRLIWNYAKVELPSYLCDIFVLLAGIQVSFKGKKDIFRVYNSVFTLRRRKDLSFSYWYA